MTLRNLRVLPVISFTLLALPCMAQVSVPSHAPAAEGHRSTSLPFGKPGFRTQIVIDSSAIAPNGAVLTGLRLRGDRVSAPLSATSVPNVTVTMSHTTLSAGSLGTDFASNVTGPATVVFSGTVNLPAEPISYAGPLGWDIVLPLTPYSFDGTQSNLLIDIVGNNAAGQPTNYYLDAEQPGGAATTFGSGPPLSNFDYPFMLATVGGFGDPELFSPGNTIEFTVSTSFSTPPTLMVFGFTAPAAPVDLSVIGAAGSFAFVEPVALEPVAWSGGFIGSNGVAPVAVPNLPSVVGAMLYAQALMYDPPANSLGWITTGAIEVRIGDSSPLPMQQLDASDPNAATGTLLDFGWFGNPIPGAVPVLLEGTFF